MAINERGCMGDAIVSPVDRPIEYISVVLQAQLRKTHPLLKFLYFFSILAFLFLNVTLSMCARNSSLQP